MRCGGFVHLLAYFSLVAQMPDMSWAFNQYFLNERLSPQRLASCWYIVGSQ